MGLTKIANISMSSISYDHNLDKKFILPNMLHIPSINKNLLSMAQFTKENNVLIEFHVDFVYMKDNNIRYRLIQGKLKNGLYAIDVAIHK